MFALKITFLFVIFLQSCVSYFPNGHFGKLADNTKANRQWLSDLDLSESMQLSLKKNGIDPKKICFQKVSYFNDKSSAVMLEIHAQDCRAKLGSKAIATANWLYLSKEDSRFERSQFSIDDRIVGETNPNTDVVNSFCTTLDPKACNFERNAAGNILLTGH